MLFFRKSSLWGCYYSRHVTNRDVFLLATIRYVDFYAISFLILYPSLENSTTPNAIMYSALSLNSEFVETIGNDLTNHDIVWIECNISKHYYLHTKVYSMNSRDTGSRRSGKSGGYDIPMKYTFGNKSWLILMMIMSESQN